MGTGYYLDIDMGRFLLLCMKCVAPDFIYRPNASDILQLQLDKSHQSDPTQEELPQKFWALGAVTLAHDSTTNISTYVLCWATYYCCPDALLLTSLTLVSARVADTNSTARKNQRNIKTWKFYSGVAS